MKNIEKERESTVEMVEQLMRDLAITRRLSVEAGECTYEEFDAMKNEIEEKMFTDWQAKSEVEVILETMAIMLIGSGTLEKE